MNPRALACFVLAVSGAGSAFLGCAGGEGEPMSVTTPMQTPTVTAPATPTPTPTVEVLSLDEYLVLTLRIDADMNRIAADLSAFPNLQEDPERFRQIAIELNRAVSQIIEDAIKVMDSKTKAANVEVLRDYSKEIHSQNSL